MENALWGIKRRGITINLLFYLFLIEVILTLFKLQNQSQSRVVSGWPYFTFNWFRKPLLSLISDRDISHSEINNVKLLKSSTWLLNLINYDIEYIYICKPATKCQVDFGICNMWIEELCQLQESKAGNCIAAVGSERNRLKLLAKTISWRRWLAYSTS